MRNSPVASASCTADFRTARRYTYCWLSYARWYEDGRTAAIELLGGEGDPDRLNTLVSKLAAQNPDVIIALTDPAALALKKAKVASPVVFAFVSDPVGLGIVKSLARPDGNFTGLTYGDAAL